jgi:hypothetical protein
MALLTQTPRRILQHSLGIGKMGAVAKETGIGAVSPEEMVVKMLEGFQVFLVTRETECRPKIFLCVATGTLSFRVGRMAHIPKNGSSRTAVRIMAGETVHCFQVSRMRLFQFG